MNTLIQDICLLHSQLENGCSGVFVMVVSSRSPKACSKTWVFCFLPRFGLITIVYITEFCFLDIMESRRIKRYCSTWAWSRRWPTWLHGLYTWTCDQLNYPIFAWNYSTQMAVILWTFQATIYGEGGTSRTIFYPFSGVTEELKAFFNDISETSKVILES